jgi:hypothetical protein
MLFGLHGVGAEPRNCELTASDRKQADAVLSRLKTCAATEDDKMLIKELEKKIQLMFFLRGTTLESRKALRILEKQHEFEMIVRGLQHKHLDRKNAAAVSLAQMPNASTSIVSKVVKALSDANFSPEGSEGVGAHKEYKKNLIVLLSRFTTLEIDVNDYDDDKQIAGVVQRVREWVRKADKERK